MTVLNSRAVERAQTWARWATDGIANRSTIGAKAQLRAKMASASRGWESRFHAQLGPGGRAVDVGSHVGALASLWVENYEEVWAFEPNPDHATRLYRSLDPRIIVFPAACGVEAGSAWLTVPHHHGRPVGSLGSLRSEVDGVRHRVPVVRLDDVVPGPIDLLKIDAEGFEVAVLDGAAGLLKHRPVVIVESEERHCPGAPAEVRARLEAVGLRGLMVVGSTVGDVADFDPAVHQAGEPSLTGDGDPNYTEQFVYVPSEEVARWRERLLGCL